MNSKTAARIRLTPALWALLAACGLLHAALLFTPWAWPAIDGYPTIERYIDPTYLTTDFYTNTSGTYGVDSIQAYLLAGLQHSTGIGYAQALGFFNLLRCLAFPAILCDFYLALGAGTPLALSAVVLGTLSNFALPKTLGWQWLWADASTAMFGVLANTLAWSAAMRRQAGRSLVWLALSALIHPLTCTHGFALVPLIFFLVYSPEERKAVLTRFPTWAGAALFAIAFLGQYFALKADPSEQLSTIEYTQIVAVIRHPGDFLVERFSARDLTAFFLGAAACVCVLWRARRTPEWVPNQRLVWSVLLSYTAIACAGYLFVSVIPSRFFVQLIPFRMANFVAPFLLYLVGCFAARRFLRGDYVSLAALALAALAASPIGGRLPVVGAQHLVFAPLLLLVCVGAEPLLDRLEIGERVSAWLKRFGLRPHWAMLGGGLLLLALAAGWTRRSEFRIPTVANQHPLYAWLQAQTPKDATVLVDQHAASGGYGTAINPQKVRLIGRRAVVASLDFPFLDKDMRPWAARWETVLAGRTLDRVNHADFALLQHIQSAYPFDYVVRTDPLPTEAQAELVKHFDPNGAVPAVFVYRMPQT